MDDIVSIPEFEGFEWDEANAQKNWQNHGVSPSEAEQVFFRKPLLAVEDVEHSQEEQRYFVLGQTDRGRMLFIAFTIRQGAVRVVSARDMSRKEKKVYSRL
ncbi:BrnT family toxin [Anaerobaca lacustris]|uniref:BrnT family toxin n=1 Tax=Anaerobaca lacustris TaxID=3044600 RepID=A0AAW6TUL4_9BACT|nr:BrnT family toxin [Sedimentisphaerales bacterium M17dextr]